MREIPEEDQTEIIFDDDKIAKAIENMKQAEKNKSIMDNLRP